MRCELCGDERPAWEFGTPIPGEGERICMTCLTPTKRRHSMRSGRFFGVVAAISWQEFARLSRMEDALHMLEDAIDARR